VFAESDRREQMSTERQFAFLVKAPRNLVGKVFLVCAHQYRVMELLDQATDLWLAQSLLLKPNQLNWQIKRTRSEIEKYLGETS